MSGQAESHGSRKLGPLVAFLALAAVLTAFAVLMGLTPIEPGQNLVIGLLVVNIALVVLLIGAVAWELSSLIRARVAGLAGAKLHTRIVWLFSLVAFGPLVMIATIALITLERGLTPWFSGALRELVVNASTIANEYQQQLCQNVAREMRLLATDIEGARSTGAYDSNRPVFRNYMTARALALGFPYAVMLSADGAVLERAAAPANAIEPPAAASEDLQAAAADAPTCNITGQTIGTIMKLPGFSDAYLYVARGVSPRSVEFPLLAEQGTAQYQLLDSRRQSTQFAITVLFIVIAVVVLLSAIMLALRFSNRLINPIRRLILATDQVSIGNLYVQVPVAKADGDVAHLGSTFNKMTAELRSQQNRLLAASDLIDRRRRFMEAVLAGVPAAVIGLDEEGRISLVNATAERLLGAPAAELAGTRPGDRIAQLGPLIEEALHGAARSRQEPISVDIDGKQRALSVRITTETGEKGLRGMVVTLDDITDLVQAQRTSAWADVARRIAHEIKNPLTPIQLSAERIRRKYGKVIGADREVFDQCTDTIIRQVEDIKRMVDEFSSFARMPKPAPAREDLVETLRQVLFLIRVAHPAVEFIDAAPEQRVEAVFDRRLIGQALQNILKNAAEGVAAAPAANGEPPRVTLELHAIDAWLVIDITDNGIGFPPEHRQRLLEPYMTTREGGTGLGLPIVAKILEDHGGAIQLLDSPAVETGGRGARVRLWLPREPAQGAAAPAAVPESGGAPLPLFLTNTGSVL